MKDIQDLIALSHLFKYRMELFVGGQLFRRTTLATWEMRNLFYVTGLIHNVAARLDMVKINFLREWVQHFLPDTSCKQISIQERMERDVVLHSADVVE